MRLRRSEFFLFFFSLCFFSYFLFPPISLISRTNVFTTMKGCCDNVKVRYAGHDCRYLYFGPYFGTSRFDTRGSPPFSVFNSTQLNSTQLNSTHTRSTKTTYTDVLYCRVPTVERDQLGALLRRLLLPRRDAQELLHAWVLLPSLEPWNDGCSQPAGYRICHCPHWRRYDHAAYDLSAAAGRYWSAGQRWGLVCRSCRGNASRLSCSLCSYPNGQLQSRSRLWVRLRPQLRYAYCERGRGARYR